MKLTTEKPEKMNETKCWFFKKISRIDKPLIRLIKKNRRHIINSRNETEGITTDPADMESIIKE